MAKLHGMLKIAGESINKNSNHVMIVQKDSRKQKRFVKGKGKGKGKAKDEISKPNVKPKSGPSPKDK